MALVVKIGCRYVVFCFVIRFRIPELILFCAEPVVAAERAGREAKSAQRKDPRGGRLAEGVCLCPSLCLSPFPRSPSFSLSASLSRTANTQKHEQTGAGARHGRAEERAAERVVANDTRAAGGQNADYEDHRQPEYALLRVRLCCDLCLWLFFGCCFVIAFGFLLVGLSFQSTFCVFSFCRSEFCVASVATTPINLFLLRSSVLKTDRRFLGSA